MATARSFADYTQGLEDNGLAPQDATNRNQALPAIATKQTEAGMRIPLASDVDMVAGYFDIQKPYFNLDSAQPLYPAGPDRQSGHRIVAGRQSLRRALDIVAGALWSEPKVVGAGVTQGLVGHRPVGIASQRYNVNANWHPPGYDDVTLGMEVGHQSNVASVLERQRDRSGTNLASIVDTALSARAGRPPRLAPAMVAEHLRPAQLGRQRRRHL